MIGLLRLLSRHSLPLFVGIVLCSLVAGMATTALLAVVNGFLGASGGADEAAQRFVASCVVALVTSMASQLMLAHASGGILYQLQVRICEGIVALPFRQFEVIGSARLRAGLTEDIPALSQGLVTLPILVTNLTTVVGAIAYLAYLSGATFVFWLLMMAVAVATLVVLMMIFGRLNELTRRAIDALYEGFDGLIGGAIELRLNAARRRAFMTRGIDDAAGELKVRRSRAFVAQAIIETWSRLLLFVSLGLVLFLGSVLIGFGDDVAQGFVLVMMFIMAPLGAMMALLPMVSRASVAAKSLESLDTLLADIDDPRDDVAEPMALKRIELRDIELTRRDDRGFRVGPVSLTLEAGKTTFIVGGNGSGKSTLAKIIAGLYPPETGQVIVDGRTIGPDDWEWYRQHVSAVFSDFHVFDTLYGLDRDALDERASEHLALLGLEDVVEVTDGRFSTLAVSTGQRKRLALLVAMLERRPLYVFDEWAADQDPDYKRVFYEQLLVTLRDRGCAVVVVTHDDAYFHLADEVVTMREGALDEDNKPVTAAPRASIG